MKKVLLCLQISVFGVSTVFSLDNFSPLQLPVLPAPLQAKFTPQVTQAQNFGDTQKIGEITKIIGSITDENNGPLYHHRFKDYQVRFAGYSCRTDQNGCFYFACKKQSLAEPLFILIGNGNYWINQTEVIGSKSFLRPIIKQDPNKPYLFFKSRFENDELFFDRMTLDSFCFEIPSERTLIININAEYVEDKIGPTKNFFFNGTGTLPHIKLKSLKEIVKLKNQKRLAKGGQPYHHQRFSRRLKDKSWLRKCKHAHNHEEVIIRQTFRETKPNSRKAYVMISVPGQE